ncbi:hypothetical protein CHARACLAT_010227 [Characodon lateralis]|uniref:Uncharacterized protein n=1 Tax=Characodon lateralis TaxID=208331 RepID=A0ABU7CWE1_9TELE|nr:hypothetical protein [Characodon lateralis]
MRVGMYDCDCACLFFVSGWVLGCSHSWISLAPPSNVGPISSLPHYLPVVGVSARRCSCGSQYLGLGALVCAGSLLVALLGLCLASDMSRGLRSLVHGYWICSGVDGYRRGL